jgi:hypothetical protein
MAMTDHVANAEPSKEKRTTRSRISFFTVISFLEFYDVAG